STVLNSSLAQVIRLLHGCWEKGYITGSQDVCNGMPLTPVIAST
ncbi:MAG: hypothetical protein HW380_2851, partial [Magnetococcales bacterium]|nr:hypothetical protein [Magnetococcales bacterium]